METLQTATTYLGLRLPHPFIAGASPFGYYLDTIKRLEDAGCAAVVLHSLFEEQTSFAAARHPENMNGLDRLFGETVAHFPTPGEYPLTPDEYAEHINRAKSAVRIPIIASFNGSGGQSWLRLVKIIEQAGADALELNFYDVVASLARTGAAVEDEIVATARELKGAMTIPLAVKLLPYFASFANLAKRLEAAGADSLVLFNRLYHLDIDIKTSEPFVNLRLSTSAELRLRLQWMAILHGRVRPSLALTGGVETPDDGITAVLAGADVVQLVSALLRHGPEHIGLMRLGLERWMERQKFSRLDEARGRCSLDCTGDPTMFDRGNYIRTLHSWIRT